MPRFIFNLCRKVFCLPFVFFVYAMHWIDPVISFFRLSVWVSVNRSVVERLRPHSLPIFTKFCMRLRNVVASTPIVSETNRSSLLILEVCDFDFGSFQALVTTFSTDQHQIPCTDKIQQY